MTIILLDFTNPDKINKIKKSWSNSNPDCLVENNVTGGNHFRQVIINLDRMATRTVWSNLM